MKKYISFIAGTYLILLASCGSSEHNDNPKDPTVGQRVDTTLQDIKTTSEQAGDNLKDAADTTKSDIKEAANDVKDGVSDAYHATKKAVKKGTEKVEEKTKEVDKDLKDK